MAYPHILIVIELECKTVSLLTVIANLIFFLRFRGSILQMLLLILKSANDIADLSLLSPAPRILPFWRFNALSSPGWASAEPGWVSYTAKPQLSQETQDPLNPNSPAPVNLRFGLSCWLLTRLLKSVVKALKQKASTFATRARVIFPCFIAFVVYTRW